MDAHMCICTRVYPLIYVHVHTYTHIYMHTHVYTYTHLHIQTHTTHTREHGDPKTLLVNEERGGLHRSTDAHHINLRKLLYSLAFC